MITWSSLSKPNPLSDYMERVNDQIFLVDDLPDVTYDYVRAYFAQREWPAPGYHWVAPNFYINGVYEPREGMKLKILRSIPVMQEKARGGFRYRLLSPLYQKDCDEACRILSARTPFKISIWSPAFVPVGEHYSIQEKCFEAWYDTRQVLAGIEDILGKRGMAYLRKYDAECSWHIAMPKDADALDLLITRWKEGQGGTKKQVAWDASGRQLVDWVRKGYQNFGMWPHIAYRNGEPVAASCIVPVESGKAGWAVQAFAKALNYSSSPGGGNNMSAWELWRECRFCQERHINKLNVGGYHHRKSKYQALYQFKKKFLARGGGILRQDHYWYDGRQYYGQDY